MYIKLPDLIRKYGIAVKGIIHVGGHTGEEADDYRACGISRVCWVEPGRPAFEVLKSKLQYDPGAVLINCAFGDKDEDGRVMWEEHVNFGTSNSLLAPKKHLEEYPSITFAPGQTVTVRKMDRFTALRDGSYNFLNMDVQGYELKVLQGGVETLKTIDYVYTEVNRAEIYENCARIEELDAFLSDFTRVETFWCDGGVSGTWGDAFYIRKSK